MLNITFTIRTISLEIENWRVCGHYPYAPENPQQDYLECYVFTKVSGSIILVKKTKFYFFFDYRETGNESKCKLFKTKSYKKTISKSKSWQKLKLVIFLIVLIIIIIFWFSFLGSETCILKDVP